MFPAPAVRLLGDVVWLSEPRLPWPPPTQRPAAGRRMPLTAVEIDALMIDRRTALLAGAAALTTAASGRPAAASLGMASGCHRLPDGRQLAYLEFGPASGPLALYFHGTPGAPNEAKLIADEIAAAGIRLIALARPGIDSSTYQSNRRILTWPADVANFVDAIGYRGPFGILGLSGGAPYALACLHAMPERLSHVAVCSGHTPINAPGAGRGNQDHVIELVDRRPNLASAFIGRQLQQLNHQPDRVVARVSEGWAESDRRLLLHDPVMRSELIRTLKAAGRRGPDGLVADVRLLARSWGFALNCLDGSRASIWQGGCDPIAPPSMGRYFHRQLRGSTLAIDEAAGHITMLKWHAAEILQHFV